MVTADDFLKKLESIDVDLSAQIAMEETASDATLAQQYQLFQGLTGYDESIKPPYHPNTIKQKIKKGQPSDRVTLRDTGSFYKGILLDVRGDTFVIESADYKSEKLQKRYGEEILLLGTKAREQWIDTLNVAFLDQIKKYLQG